MMEEDENSWRFFILSRLDAYFLTIITGIENTERVASDFSNAKKYVFF